MLQFLDNYPLSKITTLQIGGPAKKFVAVKNEEELLEALRFAKNNNLNHLIIGGGSNLLVADEEVDSLVIKNEISGITKGKATSEPMDLKQAKVTLKAKSGTPLQNLVNYTIAHGLAGLQKLTGIPGTVGGAIYGNAGAYGQTISDHLSSVQILGSNNLTIKHFSNSDCAFSYRDSIFKKNHQIILEATFSLMPDNPQNLALEAKEIWEKRQIKYPAGIKCPGSFFKNLVAAKLPADILKTIPQDKIVYGKIPAGALLESVGAKGQSSDGVEITANHANLFINKGGGSAKAFYTLAKTYAQKVTEKFNITLEPEVQLINLPPL